MRAKTFGAGPVALWLALCLLCLPGLCFGATVTTTISPETMILGTSATLQVTVENGNPRTLPSFPAQPNLTLQYTGRPSSQTMSINGKTSTKVILNFIVNASKTGEYTIPSANLQVDGTTMATQPVKLRVVKDDNTAQKPAFLKLIVPRNRVYVGELFPVEIQLYVTAAQNVEMPQLKSEGFTVGKQIQAPTTRVQLNGMIYNLVSFKMSVAAARTGQLTLGPAECSLVLRVASNRRGGRDLMDEFFGGGVELQQMNLASEPLAMNVLPVPKTNAPPSFNGALGNFTFAVSASNTNVTAGDPITLHIEVAGQGSLDSLSLPNLDWREFKLYPPTTTLTNTDQLGLEGVKTFDLVIVPQNAEVREIPPIPFSYFDPESRAFRTIQQPAVPIVVKPTAVAQAQPTVLAGSSQAAQTPKQAQDIVHIKTRLGSIPPAGGALVQSPWFATLQGVPLAAWLATLVWRKRKTALENNPRLLRRRRVEKAVAAGIAELRNQAQANRSDEFFAGVFRLLQEQLGERLDLPSSAITEAALDDPKFWQLNPPQALTDELRNLFHLCNHARYGGQRSSQELASLAAAAEKTLTATGGLGR